MRTRDEVAAAAALFDQGVGDSEISRRLGIPRTTVHGWRASAGDLAGRFDPVCARCGQPEHHFASLPKASYCYLLGLYLGDGYLATYPRGVFALRIFMDSAYPDVVDMARMAVVDVAPKRTASVGRSKSARMATVCSYSKQWPCLLPQHGPGRKHERDIRLTGWQRSFVAADPRPLIRGLIHSDGCRFINRVKTRNGPKSYGRYNFTNASADIRSIFCEACSSLGVEWRQMNQRTVSVARRESVALLDSFVEPKT